MGSKSPSISERTKKMKMTPSSQCPLFNVKITDEESILVKGERVWIPGFLAFATKFSKWEDDFSITPQLIEEAKYKLAKLESGVVATMQLRGKALLYCFQTGDPVSGGPMANLNKQAFWLNALEDNLCSALIQSIKLDATNEYMEDLLHLIYGGVMYTFSWSPSLSVSLVEAFKTTFQKILHGDDFYSFHPIRLVTVYLWIKDLQGTLRLFVDKFHPSRNIPLNVDLAIQAVPMPELRNIHETSVSDQTSAIAQCEGGGGMLMNAVFMLHAASSLFGVGATATATDPYSWGSDMHVFNYTY